MSPDRPADPIAVAIAFVGLLERLGIPYVIGELTGSFIGGISSSGVYMVGNGGSVAVGLYWRT